MAAPLLTVTDDLDVDPHALATIVLTSPNGSNPAPLSVVELDVQVQISGTPAPGHLGASPGNPAHFGNDTRPFDGHDRIRGTAVAHFQMPQAGTVRIDASVGSVRAGLDFQ